MSDAPTDRDRAPAEPPSEPPPADEPTSRWRDLWTKEDYWAIWLGFALIAVGLAVFLPNPPADMRERLDEANRTMQTEARRATPAGADEPVLRTVAWYKAHDAKSGVKGAGEGYAKTIATWTGKPHGWKDNPLDAFYLSEAKAAAKRQKARQQLHAAQKETAKALAAAKAAEETAAAAGFKDAGLNQSAGRAIDAWRDTKKLEAQPKKGTKARAHVQVVRLLALGAALAVFFAVGIRVMGQSMRRFMLGFAFVFALAVLAYMLEGQKTMKEYGIGYAAWAILLGLLVSNTIGTPRWAVPAVQVEYYIKTGLVLLGAEILFGKIVTIGIPGIFVAWVVTPVVLVSTFWFGDKVLKVTSKTLNITIAAAMSVCGVSAAIATAGACRAKKEELTLAVGMSLIFTAAMMVGMPAFIKWVDMDVVVGGAWMGGTIDATGAVAAAGAFLGERALYVSATIKMIQNVLIGVIAFGVALYWCTVVETRAGQRVGAGEIWRRFPKFVLGFVAASILFSIVYQLLGRDVGKVLVDDGVIKGFTKTFRGWFFCLAFVGIGLATNFRELAQHFRGGKLLALYVFGQGFNLVLTLVMAYLMFCVVFPQITAGI